MLPRNRQAERGEQRVSTIVRFGIELAYTILKPINDKIMNHTYKVTMNERQKDGSIRTITQTAVCHHRQQVIDWYGLNEPDIISYTIEEIS